MCIKYQNNKKNTYIIVQNNINYNLNLYLLHNIQNIYNFFINNVLHIFSSRPRLHSHLNHRD